MRVLVYGCAPLFRMLLPRISAKDHQITIVDEELDSLKLLPQQDSVEAIWIAEPALQDYLRQGGIHNTQAFLALSKDDYKNVLVSQIALHIFRVPKVVCYLEAPHLQQLYTTLGVQVVGPNLDLIDRLEQAIGE